MIARAKKAISRNRVQSDLDSIIVRFAKVDNALAVNIFRRRYSKGSIRDLLIHERFPANKTQALRLADDLAELTGIDVYVLRERSGKPRQWIPAIADSEIL